MSDILRLSALLRDTHAELARAEQRLLHTPEDDFLELGLQSIRKRASELNEEFLALTEQNLIDVCDYRILPLEDGIYPIAGVGQALIAFQDLISVFFDAIHSGPKQRFRLSAEVSQQTSLNFAYSYSGSLGMTFTLPNERLLIGESHLDMAFHKAFDMAEADSTADISALVNELGVPAVRKMYNWASNHAKHGVAVEIKWKRGNQIRSKKLLQKEDLERITRLIEATSEQQIEDVTVSGTLTGLDLTGKLFRLHPIEGGDIRGHLSPDFTYSEALPIPSNQKAFLRKFSTVHFSTEKEDVTWQLIKLAPI